MSGIGSLASRLVVVALVAVGLVGMHHLVVAACHHASAHSAHSLELGEPVASGHGAHGSVPATPPHSPEQSPHEGPGGLVGAAATCLAVLLMILGLVLPQVTARLRRWRASICRPRLMDVPSWTLRPPDLTLLSVSRT